MAEILLWNGAKLKTEDIAKVNYYKLGAKKGFGFINERQLVTTEEELHIVMKDKNDKKDPITGYRAGLIADQLDKAGFVVMRH